MDIMGEGQSCMLCDRYLVGEEHLACPDPDCGAKYCKDGCCLRREEDLLIHCLRTGRAGCFGCVWTDKCTQCGITGCGCLNNNQSCCVCEIQWEDGDGEDMCRDCAERVDT
jgi:hypothetical protein